MSNVTLCVVANQAFEKVTRTKVESDRLGRLKVSYKKQVKEFSRGLSRGAAVCTLYTDSHCTVQSVLYQ